jgi:hypothetical protein
MLHTEIQLLLLLLLLQYVVDGPWQKTAKLPAAADGSMGNQQGHRVCSYPTCHVLNSRRCSTPAAAAAAAGTGAW